MSRKRCSRTVWLLQPGSSPIELARFNASRLTVEEWNEQLIPVQVALDSMTAGDWSPENWAAICECLNRVEAILRQARVPDQGLIEQCQAATLSATDRHMTSNVRAFKHDELATLRELVAVYGDLLREITHKDFSNACRSAKANWDRVVKQKRSKNEVAA